MLAALIFCLVIFGSSDASDYNSCEVVVYNTTYDNEYFSITRFCYLNATVILADDTSLSNAFDDQMEKLYVEDNEKITYLPVDLVKNFPNLRRIDFLRTGIISVSKKPFRSFSNLKHLEIANGKLSSVDEDAFDDLKNLEWLTLYANKLASLPAGFLSKLFELEYVDLSQNELTFLDPATFKNNKKLNTINLSTNQFTSFAPGLFDPLTESLWSVNVQNNKISTLDSHWFKDFKKFISLSLSYNEFTEIPQDFFTGLPTLAGVSLNQNPLKFIDFAVFENNKNLVELFFTWMNVSEVRNIDVIDSLPLLERVDFSFAKEGSCLNEDFTDKQELKKRIKENCKSS